MVEIDPGNYDVLLVGPRVARLAPFFTQWGFQVVSRTTGGEGVSSLKAQAFHLTIMELDLEDLESHEFIAAATRIQPRSSFMLLDDPAKTGMIVSTFVQGVDVYVPTPPDEKRLYEQVARQVLASAARGGGTGDEVTQAQAEAERARQALEQAGAKVRSLTEQNQKLESDLAAARDEKEQLAQRVASLQAAQAKGEGQGTELIDAEGLGLSKAELDELHSKADFVQFLESENDELKAELRQLKARLAALDEGVEEVATDDTGEGEALLSLEPEDDAALVVDEDDEGDQLLGEADDVFFDPGSEAEDATGDGAEGEGEASPEGPLPPASAPEEAGDQDDELELDLEALEAELAASDESAVDEPTSAAAVVEPAPAPAPPPDDELDEDEDAAVRAMLAEIEASVEGEAQDDDDGAPLFTDAGVRTEAISIPPEVRGEVAAARQEAGLDISLFDEPPDTGAGEPTGTHATPGASTETRQEESRQEASFGGAGAAPVPQAPLDDEDEATRVLDADTASVLRSAAAGAAQAGPPPVDSEEDATRVGVEATGLQDELPSEGRSADELAALEAALLEFDGAGGAGAADAPASEEEPTRIGVEVPGPPPGGAAPAPASPASEDAPSRFDFDDATQATSLTALSAEELFGVVDDDEPEASGDDEGAFQARAPADGGRAPPPASDLGFDEPTLAFDVSSGPSGEPGTQIVDGIAEGAQSPVKSPSHTRDDVAVDVEEP